MLKQKTPKLSEYDKKMAAMRRQQERQREKLRENMANPEWREAQYQAGIEAAKKAVERRKEREKKKREEEKVSDGVRQLANAPQKTTSTKKKSKPKHGEKGRTPTAKERRHMDKVGKLPCIACYLKGQINWRISLHHTNGRVAPDCHMVVLPLCAYHHQNAAPKELREQYPWLIPIHADLVVGSKKEFARLFGSNDELLALVDKLIEAGVESWDGVFVCREIV